MTERKKKIRGHRKRQKQIELWKDKNILFNLTDYFLNGRRNYYYAKIPWNYSSITNSNIPEPKGKTKQLLFAALLDIYDAWKVQLERLGEPYYLKIWLYEPRFSQSEVVCATGGRIEYYQNMFYGPEKGKYINGPGHKNAEQLNWECYIDEDHYDLNFIGNPEDYASLRDYKESEQWFSRLLKKPHRITHYENPDNSILKLYSFKRGNVWVGGE